jgi:hypothetical protein
LPSEQTRTYMAKSYSMDQTSEPLLIQDPVLLTHRQSHPTTSHLPPLHQDWLFDDESFSQKPKKQSNQIAKELSDMIIYVQAIKFRCLNTISPNSSGNNRITPALVPASSTIKKGNATPTGTCSIFYLLIVKNEKSLFPCKS